MVEEQVVAGLSDLSLSELPRKRPNFPLPRELRDQIYGYLLDHEYTRVNKKAIKDPDIDKYRDTGLVAYKFHTAILAVNRTIGSEAKELMYKRNIFVVLSYQWPPSEAVFGDLLSLPTVSLSHVSKMQLHSLRIHHSITPGNKSNFPIKSCIVLADDLKAFCCVARAVTEERIDSSVQLDFAPHNVFVKFNAVDRSNRFYSTVKCLCDLRDTQYRSMDETLQHSLLASLATIQCTNQRVIFKGAVRNAHEAEHLKQLMSPSINCLEAMLVSGLQTMIMAKDIADASIQHNELAFVIARYESIAEQLLDSLGDETHARVIREGFPKFAELQETMVTEIAINIACGNLKLRRIDAFGFWLSIASNILERIYLRLGPIWNVSHGIVDYFHSLGLWWMLYREGRVLEVNNHDIPTLTVEQEVHRLEGLHGFTHQAHDLAILRSYPDQQATLTAEILPYDRCSVSQLPFPTTSFYKSVESFKQYTQSRGWYDIPCFKTLDEKTMSRVKQLQKQHGLPVTDFELLYADFNQKHETGNP